jgi:hypothetical protein
VWLLCAAILWWGRLPSAWRRGAALLASAGGVLALLKAVNSEGVRESSTLGFLIATPYVTEQASASASLPYYLLTGMGLALGTLGLALRDELAARLARHWFSAAIALSLLITALRFTLEKAAAPRFWTWAVGVTWLAPLVGAFFAVNLRGAAHRFRALGAWLAAYALIVRGAVALLMLAATKNGLGSHYDMSSLVRVQHPLSGRVYEFVPGSFEQLFALVLAPQLLVWPAYTVLAGMLGGGVAWVILESGGTANAQPLRVPAQQAASEDN